MIYLDHAATSFPKPPAVLDAVQRWFTEQGVSAGRGDSELCRRVANTVDDVRQRLGQMCGVPARRVVFTASATESLNLFLDGFLRPGDRVLTTALEHSSLVRPLVHGRERRGIEFDVLPPCRSGRVSPEAFDTALGTRAYRLVAFSHASNVLGTVLDAAAICAIAKRHGTPTLLDASPTAGLLDLDIGADAIVASAHKSLLAPPGLGFLAVTEAIDLPPTRFGGTGSSIALDRQPTEWPTAMESGTPNTPAIVGLSAALAYIERRGREAILAHELHVMDILRTELADHAEFHGTFHGESHGASTQPRIPILSLTPASLDPAEAGMLLDAAGIHVRTGFHCAPWLHQHLGTAAAGTVRVSAGPFATTDDVLALARVLVRR